jgi:predicted MFS family arabinose efflux permease
VSRYVWVLALGTFAVGTDGFVIAGILGHIASDLDVSLRAAGQLETAFALTIAIGGPVLMTVLGVIAPKRMLVLSMLVFTVANIAAALSPGFVFLMAMRVLAAASVAVFMAAAPTAAMMVTEEEQRGRALGAVMSGMTAGIVVGVPVGILINDIASWRETFVLAAALGAAAAFACYAVIPQLPAPPAVKLRERVEVMRQPAILVMLSSVTIWMIGGYTLYNYMGPMLESESGFDSSILPLLFLGFGITAVAGNLLGGWLTDRIGPNRTIVFGLIGGGAGLALASLLATSQVGVVLALILWSTAGWTLTAPQQFRLIGQAPQATPILMSLNSSALYLGIALGAVAGGIVLSVGSLRDLGWTGSLWELAALALTAVSVRQVARQTRHKERSSGRFARDGERAPDPSAVS